MTNVVEGLPAELVSFDTPANTVNLTIDAGIYPLEAVYGASYIFIDRCYVFVDRPEATKFKVSLSPKKGETDAEKLKALAGEFANELLSCAWRHQITQENRAIIEAVTSQALAGAMGPPSLDELAAFDFAEEPFEDPLGIAMSWEDKYKKKAKPDDEAPKDALKETPKSETASATPSEGKPT